MEPNSILLGLTAIMVLGVGAQWLGWRVRLPSILLLLVTGLIVGPGLGLLDPDRLIGRDLLFPLVSLSVAVILFEGGLSLDLGELREIGYHLLRLVTLGIAVTWVLAAGAAHWIVGLEWPLAILLGAILTVTGPTVIGPLLRHVRPTGAVGSIAKWEGIVADVIGATLAVLVFQALHAGFTVGDRAIGSSVWGMLKTILFGGVVGVAGAYALSIPLKRHWIPDYLQSPVALAVVIAVFTLSDQLQHESGLLAVTLVGFLLANQRTTPIAHIVEFKENLRVLLISSLFIVLSARLSVADIEATSWRDLAFVAVLVVFIRPASVFLSALGSGLQLRDKLFLCCMAPRGIVAAAVSALFAAELGEVFPAAGRLTSITFLVIIGTVTVYGLAAAPLARRLGLADANPQGTLIVGGGAFALELAKALKQAGSLVVLVDTNREAVAAARLAGLRAVYGNVLDHDVEGRIPMGGLGRLFALTPNDNVNSLAALHFTELFGRAGVYQLAPGEPGAGARDLRGRDLFAEGADYGDLARRLSAGAAVKATPITEEYDYAAYRERNGDRALPLMKINKVGTISVFTPADEPGAAAGDVLLGLVTPSSLDGAEPGPDADADADPAASEGDNQEARA